MKIEWYQHKTKHNKTWNLVSIGCTSCQYSYIQLTQFCMASVTIKPLSFAMESMTCHHSIAYWHGCSLVIDNRYLVIYAWGEFVSAILNFTLRTQCGAFKTLIFRPSITYMFHCSNLWFTKRLVTCSAPTLYLNQCSDWVNLALRNIVQGRWQITLFRPTEGISAEKVSVIIMATGS